MLPCHIDDVPSLIYALYCSPTIADEIDAVQFKMLSYALYVYGLPDALIDDVVFCKVYISCRYNFKLELPVGSVLNE
jgi:hypothetical protein